MPDGVPQGTKFGPWLFLRVPHVLTCKYVDDTTIAEIVPQDAAGDAQAAVTHVENCSREQNMQLNADKMQSHGN